MLKTRDEGASNLEIFLAVPAMVLLSLVPFLIYMSELRSLFSSVLVGFALLVTTAGMFWLMLNTDSASAYFGFVAAPAVNLLVVAIGIFLDFLRLGPARRL